MNCPSIIKPKRIPPTEKRGRVHTSTVTVAVLNNEPDKNIFELNEDDLEIQWYSGTGKGGQNRNKVQTCCRLKHKPTGLITTAQTRSRTNSLDNARKSMIEQLHNMVVENTNTKINNVRQKQVGSGERGDKVRTIQFQNDRVVDHRNGKTMSAVDFMKGNMNKLW